MGKPEQAAAAFVKYLEHVPKTEARHTARSAAVVSFVPYQAAFEKLIELRPDDTHLVVCRGRDHLARGRYTDAAADYRRIIATRPASEDWVEAGEAYLLSGDAAGYRDLCQALIGKAGEKLEPFDYFVLARCGGLSPSSEVAPSRLIDCAKKALDSGSAPWYQHALGLAHYRAGAFEHAIEQLEQSNASGWGDEAKSQNWLVLAMAHARAGRPEQARQCLERARSIARKAVPKEPGQPGRAYPVDWGEIQVLLREAELVVEGKRVEPSH